MKKITISIFILALLLPQITHAYWWNPFTWNIFTRTPKTEGIFIKPQATSTPVVEKIVSTTTSSTSTETIKNPPIKKVIQKATVDSNSAIIKAEVERQLKEILKTKQEKVATTSVQEKNTSTSTINPVINPISGVSPNLPANVNVPITSSNINNNAVLGKLVVEKTERTRQMANGLNYIYRINIEIGTAKEVFVTISNNKQNWTFVYGGNDFFEWFSIGDAGTYNWTVKSYTGMSRNGENNTPVLGETSGTFTITPPTPETTKDSNHLKVTGFTPSTNEFCTITTTWAGLLGTLELTGTTTPVAIKEVNPFDVSVSTKHAEIQFNQVNGNGYVLKFSDSGFQQITGTGGVLTNSPIKIIGYFNNLEIPATISFTIKSIKFADGTEVGGLPITISDLHIKNCN